MPNFKTVRQLSDRTGVSITTIRSFLKRGLFETTNHRPVRIDIHRLPKEFVCLYDPNYVPLESFLSQTGIQLSNPRLAKYGGLIRSPKQTSGYWRYIDPTDFWEWLQDKEWTDENEPLYQFQKSEKPVRKMKQSSYEGSRSLTIVFNDEVGRRNWVEDNLGISIQHEDQNVILIHNIMTAQVKSVIS